MFSTIKAQGFEINKNLEVKLYKLPLPQVLVDEFCDNFYDGKKKLLKTTDLRNLLYSISKDIVYVGDLYNLRFDNTWIISKREIDTRLLLAALKQWGMVIKTSLKKLDEKKEIKRWIGLIDNVEVGNFEEEVFKLTDENGYVYNNKIYDILPNLLANEVIDKGLNLSGINLKFYSIGDKRIISDPNLLKIQEDNYSLSIIFGIQTTPHSRKPIVVYKASISRWVKKCFNKKIIKRSNTKVYAKIDENTLYPLELSFEDGLIKWDELSSKVMNQLYISMKLPEAYNFYIDPSQYFNNNDISLYMNHRLEMGKVTLIKAGLPMNDKFDIHFELLSALEDIYISDIKEFEDIFSKKPPAFNEDIKIGVDINEFRKNLFNSIGRKTLNIEIYYEYNNEIVTMVEEKIKRDFGIDGSIEILDDYEIKIKLRRLPDILQPLDKNLNEIDRHEQRINEIKDKIIKKDELTACLVILPYEDIEGNRYFEEKTDPKYAIRAGLASIGRLTQFLTPEVSKNTEHRVNGALMDLYRQLGFFYSCGKTKAHINIDYTIPITALHVINYKKTPYGNTERALVSLTMNPKHGKIFVECPALWRGEKLYWEACLAFQEVATKEGKSKFSKTRLNNDIKNKVYELYNMSDEKHLMLIESNGITRMGWKFISDSELSKQEKNFKYRVKKIGFSNYESDLGIDTTINKSELRIIRIRANEEVPSYITPRKEDGKCVSKSTVYKYNNVFYGIGKRPNDQLYKNTFNAISKIRGDNKECKLVDMIEIYPILLKEEDIADQWAYVVNNYRNSAYQYKDSLKLPLPLHLAHKLEEYIYKKNS